MNMFQVLRIEEIKSNYWGDVVKYKFLFDIIALVE